ncbi:uncharacterized protein F4807DRAFT_453497 [Annulohypoxylon truncatum]|uniref:uncharacterized protein n=1 Tax=Annulohypoxylon truncatum TaxID=327061 RepID=UPI00200724A1|nr:uncharacterized protein F4807DRAFT_453497 [Annulohypoxylon truncatum]KAI1206302.1 hypothetical protein F4807DRAFT_453497 [Annulohypoxylon truncatum]
MSVAPGQYWNLIERNQPPVKRRTNHSKVRTGCVTCKNRRVKCDEGKPSCSRCEKSGLLCAGYEGPNPRRGKEAPPSGRSNRSTGPAALRPKSLKPWTVNTTQEIPIVDFLLPPSLAPAYLDRRDLQYFDRFRSQITLDISVWCGGDYWKSIICEVLENESIRYAALALAAMLLAAERCSALSNPSPGPLTQCQEGQVALRYYMKAISMCRKQLIGGVTKVAVRSNITSTFLFAIMEILQGNIATADQIMVNGAILIRDAIRARAPSGRPALIWDQQMLGIKSGFDKLTIMWGLSPFFHGQRDVCTLMVPEEQYSEIPDEYAPLSHIRYCWLLFQNDVGLFMTRVRCGKVVSPEYMETVILQKSKFLAQLRQWMPLLDALLERERNTSSFYPLSIMKAIALTSTIFLSCFLDRSDVSYDLHLPTFLEVIHICQRFVPDKPPTHLKLSLDVDLFPIVSFTVTKCRDQKTRQLALKIFHEMTYGQVFWHNQGMLKSLQALVDLEHKGRDKRGFVPPSSRYYFVGSEWDFEHRQMTATFVPVGSVPTESGDMPTVRVPISC